MNKSKRREKKKRRHERQIAEGTREPRVKLEKKCYYRSERKQMKLSELDSNDVRKVLDAVANLDNVP